LGGPAPVAAGVSGVGHALQFAQRVRVAQLVAGIDVSVVGCLGAWVGNTLVGVRG
jgi:hypothetical protein